MDAQVCCPESDEERPRRAWSLGAAMAVALIVTCSAPASSAPVPPVPSASGSGGARDSGWGLSPVTVRAKSIDTSDRDAVAAAWRELIESRLGVRTRWTGSVSGCRAGRPSPGANKAILDGTNFVRGLAGLSAVKFSRALSARAQAAALIMSANGVPTHAVPRSFKCYSKAGADAASRSNLHLDPGQIPADRVIPVYMTDEGPGNVLVGHRRWILNPVATTFGSGLTNTAQALLVLGPTSSRNPNPDWVPWPTQGWFPSDFEPAGRWSLSSGSGRANFSRARVRVAKDGRRLKVHLHEFAAHGYGAPALTWEVKGRLGPGTYRVSVSGIRRAASTKYTYTVRIFDPTS